MVLQPSIPDSALRTSCRSVRFFVPQFKQLDVTSTYFVGLGVIRGSNTHRALGTLGGGLLSFNQKCQKASAGRRRNVLPRGTVESCGTVDFRPFWIQALRDVLRPRFLFPALGPNSIPLCLIFRWVLSTR